MAAFHAGLASDTRTFELDITTLEGNINFQCGNKCDINGIVAAEKSETRGFKFSDRNSKCE